MLRKILLIARKNYPQVHSRSISHGQRYYSGVEAKEGTEHPDSTEASEKISKQPRNRPEKSNSLRRGLTKYEIIKNLKALKKFDNDLNVFEKSFPSQRHELKHKVQNSEDFLDLKTNSSFSDSETSSASSEISGTNTEKSVHKIETDSSSSDYETSLSSTEISGASSEQSVHLRNFEIGLNSETSLEPVKDAELDIQEKVPKKVFPKVYTLAALVNHSKCLQKLVAFGVDLSTVQKNKAIASYLSMCSFEKDIVPYLMFLRQHDVENIGKFLTRNMEIIKTDIDVLENRVDYLKSKRFRHEDISRVISNSQFLLRDVKKVDEDLGILQNLFSLSGREVREVVIKTPKLINSSERMVTVKENKINCKEFLGFSHMELKTVMLSYPGFFLKSPSHLNELFDYLHNVMEMDHKTLVKNCHVFKSRLFKIKSRHLFLLKVRRAQYDPEKENFVSLSTLVSGTNEEFCANVAKSSVEKYVEFLKCV